MNERADLALPEEQMILQSVAKLDNLHGRRAQALLALAKGSTRSEAGEVAALSVGQVKYAAALFRRRKLAMFPEAILNEMGESGEMSGDSGQQGPDAESQVAVEPGAAIDQASLFDLFTLAVCEPKIDESGQMLSSAGKHKKTKIGSPSQVQWKFGVSHSNEAEGQPQQLIAELAKSYTIKSEPVTISTQSFYDTFDWRLFRRAMTLSVSDKVLYVSRLPGGEIISQAEISKPPRFAQDLPPAILTKKLAATLDIRALIELATVQVCTHSYRVLNKRGKTVARIAYKAVRFPQQNDSSSLVTYLWLRPVRGYLKHSRKLWQRCRALGLAEINANEIYHHILAGVDRRPGDYSAKLKFNFEPQLRSDEATKTLLRFLLSIMRRNEGMIKKDIDTEFLHEFRIAVRRTRSVLSQVKGVLPAETTDRFKQDFKKIGQMTNVLRDLDVYLLSRERYKGMLPAALRSDIDPLFDYLSRKRKQTLQKVAQTLAEPHYIQTLTDWEMCLNAPATDEPTAPNAARPIIDLAQNRIYKIYKRVVKSGKQIHEDTTDDQLHDLRIECKKLRYLMEFFAHLFPPKKMQYLIKQLKKLQDILGAFNDVCIQEAYLLQLAEEMPLVNHQPAKKVLLGIGALIDALAREKEGVRASFAAAFTNFASSPNKKLVRDLFAPHKEGNAS